MTASTPALHPNIAPSDGPFIPLYAVTKGEVDAAFAQFSGDSQIAATHEFKGQAGRVLAIHGADGALARLYFGQGASFDAESFGGLAAKVPNCDMAIATAIPDGQETRVLTSYLLGAYVYDRYKTKPKKSARLAAPKGVDVTTISRIVTAVALGRDLVNTPPNHMGPDALEGAAVSLGQTYGAEMEVIKGADLLAQNYPLIHAVGRGSAQEARLVILRIGDPTAQKVALVGKGVTFDTGGLNLKPGAGMALMKKDMGGAACVLALFSALAQSSLNVRLSVYIPIVENSMDGQSFRPSDVITARNGLSVEIDNTDAEGRLILADAMTRASEDGNTLILDMATLTGAARVALGPELPPFFTDDEALASDLTASAKTTGDHLWRMPLWRPYEDDLESQIANLKNSGGPFAGAINGALFISKFVETANNTPIWAHFDVYCWNPKDKPARPAGGEVHGVRTIYDMLCARFTSV